MEGKYKKRKGRREKWQASEIGCMKKMNKRKKSDGEEDRWKKLMGKRRKRERKRGD